MNRFFGVVGIVAGITFTVDSINFFNGQELDDMTIGIAMVFTTLSFFIYGITNIIEGE